MKNIKYGNMPIKRAKFGGGHPHIIVLEIDGYYYSVGLTNSNKSGTHRNYEVGYSNGNKGFMVHYPSHFREKAYYEKCENYHIRLDDEKRAKEIVFNSKKFKNKK